MRGFGVLGLALLVCSAWHSSARADEDMHSSLDVPPNDDDLGPLIQIEAISIHGNTATQDEIIRRALPIAPGDVLKASDRRLRDARFKVLALGFFRDVELAMHKGSQRGLVIIEISVVERGTFVLNKLWFGRSNLTPYWLGVDVGERNLLGLGISAGVGAIYAAPADVDGARAQWATELRLADGSLRGTRWGANASLTLVHGSDTYRVTGDDDDDDLSNYRGFPYRRFGGRFGTTYDITALARLSGQVRIESVNAELPDAPTRTLPGGREVLVDLRLQPGESRIVTASLGFDRDTRPDPILPHAGGRITAAVELGTGALASDYDFASVFARYEHWWPLRDERHTIGIRLGGGVVVGDAPRFDRIFVSDVNRMLTPRALGLILSNAAPLDFLSTRDEKPTFGEVGGIASVEYAAQLFRGPGKRRVYGGDFFVGAGLWGLAQTDDLQLRDTSVWNALPIDLYIDAGVRVDTDLGIFELTFANALGRVR
jgi:outer membrane protein assembly factor BamA